MEKQRSFLPTYLGTAGVQLAAKEGLAESLSLPDGTEWARQGGKDPEGDSLSRDPEERNVTALSGGAATSTVTAEAGSPRALIGAYSGLTGPSAGPPQGRGPTGLYGLTQEGGLGGNKSGVRETI